jgi:hypothetical protein
MSKFLLTTVCAFGLLLSVVSAEEVETWRKDGLQKFQFTRFVPTGTKRTVEFLYGANPDCSPMDGIEVRTTHAPEHGVIEVVSNEQFPNFARDNVRFKCNDKKILGLSVNYRSAGEYVGPDGFDLLILYRTDMHEKCVLIYWCVDV